LSTKTVDIHEAKQKLKELLSLAAEGEEIVITENSTPLARLVAMPERIAGLHAGTIWTSDDFDDPLPDEFWVDNS
jgi:prevent-host-death family protein